ncbi:hypothetical protein Agub_g11897 [Astrephomene gubernaculifera]|uniref:Uncharacterized protein n=1 Tax=Astrephomene gubernaculifera TaxID=47775 RepID=A0AAD3DX98_9CHLO|nr:hypothetical protein Agub_g11897 [Astrephomene gubernaculifera]
MRRQAPAAFGLQPDAAGRGPTYERVQKLLEERRARAQAQLAAQTSQEQGAAYAAPTELGESDYYQQSAHSPRSEQSFAFDRPSTSQGRGGRPAVLEPARRSNSLARQVPDGHDPYRQHAWQPDDQFNMPAEELGVEGDFHAAQSSELQRQASLPYSEHALPQQRPHDVLRRSTQLDTQEEDANTVGADGQPTLAQLEQMLQQTVERLNMEGPEGMRVPSSKDMMFGMADVEGPFDISDLWAMESQPSNSQPSHPHESHSGTDDDPDEGHEVNSYAAAYNQQRLQQSLPSSPVQAGGNDRHRHQQQAVRDSPMRSSMQSRDRLQQQPSVQAGAPQVWNQPHPHAQQPYVQVQQPQHVQTQQPYMQAQRPHPQAQGPHHPAQRPEMLQAQQQQHQMLQAQQQQHQMQQHASAVSRGASMPRGVSPDVLRRQQQQRPVSARMQQQQQPILARHSQQLEQRKDASRVPPLRRTISPTGGHQAQRPRSAFARVSPRFNQPPRTAVESPRRNSGEFTFRPQINPRSREIAERVLPLDRARRIEELSRPRNERVEQRYEQLRQAKEEEELRNCTFQPRTGRPPSTPRMQAGGPVHERLYNVKPAWMLKRDEILREREQAALASCTFQPQCGSRRIPDTTTITTTAAVSRSNSAARRRPNSAAAAASGAGSDSTYVPIHQRVADLLRSRNEKLAKVQVKMELDGGPVTFQPEINARSAQLAAERQRQQPAEVAALPANERLYRLAQEQSCGIRRRTTGEDSSSSYGDVATARDQRQQHQQQRPAVPNINPRSRALAESSKLPQDFLTRQAYLAALGHEKRALYRSFLEESTCTFQPQLRTSKNGSLHSSGCLGPGAGGSFGPGSGSNWSGSGGGEGDRTSKLAYDDVQRSVALREALEQHHYGQYTFAPAINERSRRIGRRHSLTDLYKDEDRQVKLERLAAAAEAQRAAECTFQPAINARSASMGRQRRSSMILTSVDCHEQANKLRSSILLEARAMREHEELKECTFTPAINRTVPKHSGDVTVQGMDRHLELKELARRKREADEARKAEVWHLRPKSPGPRVGVTVPQPFSFEKRVLPWQVNRGQAAQQQQQQDQQQRALAALKQQRQQQRKVAEDRRSAQLQRIIQEAHAHEEQRASVAVTPGLRPSSAVGPQAASLAAGRGGAAFQYQAAEFEPPSPADMYDMPGPHAAAVRASQNRFHNGAQEAMRTSYGHNLPMDGYGGETFPASPPRDELRMRFN